MFQAKIIINKEKFNAILEQKSTPVKTTIEIMKNAPRPKIAFSEYLHDLLTEFVKIDFFFAGLGVIIWSIGSYYSIYVQSLSYDCGKELKNMLRQLQLYEQNYAEKLKDGVAQTQANYEEELARLKFKCLTAQKEVNDLKSKDDGLKKDYFFSLQIRIVGKTITITSATLLGVATVLSIVIKNWPLLV